MCIAFLMHEHSMLKSISHQRSLKNSQQNKFPIYTCYQHKVTKEHLAHKDLSLRSYPGQIGGTGEQFTVNPWKLAAFYVTF